MNEVPEFAGWFVHSRRYIIDKKADEAYPSWRKNFEEWKKIGSDHPYYLGSTLFFSRVGGPWRDSYQFDEKTTLETMNKLSFFLSILVGHFCFGSASQLNILWIVGENLKLDLGCYGAKNVRTPNLTVWPRREHTKVFSTSPVCG